MQAALGFRDHSGWAIAVAMGLGRDDRPELLARKRIVICPTDLPRQPYHAVAEQGFPREIVPKVQEAALALAKDQITSSLRDLGLAGHTVTAAAVGEAAGVIPDSLDAILRAHSLLHAAEGRLFREALAEAGTACGLAVRRFLQRDVFSLAAAALQVELPALNATLAALGKGAGPPWQKDHREAAAAALIALAMEAPRRPLSPS